MNRADLERRLEAAGIRRDAYQFGGGFPNERYCLTFERGRWIVHYSERGERTGTTTFESEDQANDYLFETLSRMPEARKPARDRSGND